jgi:hypothetical protein
MNSSNDDAHSALLHELEIAEALRREIQGAFSDIADVIEIQSRSQIHSLPLDDQITDRDGTVAAKVVSIQANPRLLTMSAIMARLKY